MGVKDDLPFDLDPMTLANGEWKDTKISDDISGKNFYRFYNNGKITGIQKVGDIEYDDRNKSLNFNTSDIDDVRRI